MVGRIYHVGLTVSDLDRSIAFYNEILGLEFQGEIMMTGEEIDKLFQRKNFKARLAYLNGSKAVEAPPIELIQFVDEDVNKVKSDLFNRWVFSIFFDLFFDFMMANRLFFEVFCEIFFFFFGSLEMI